MSVTCPTCDREFDDKRSVRIHHSMKHGEHLLNHTCKNCGEDFHNEYEVKYCSEECRESRVPLDGENHPNFQNKQEVTACEICGDEFEYYPSNKAGRFCPQCVAEEDWREPPTMEGSDHPRWKGGRTTLTCEVCNSTFERHPSIVDSEVTFCSTDCQYEWLSESFTGEGHPNWEGGDTGPYGPGWNRVRRLALERDKYECVLCGTSKDELGRNPDVHHITPVRRFAEADTLAVADAHDLANVVSLCVDCHRKADFGIYERATLRDAIGVTVP